MYYAMKEQWMKLGLNQLYLCLIKVKLFINKLKNTKMNIAKHTIEKVSISKIKRLSFNRDTKSAQVSSIMNSLTSHGILRLPVCVRTKAINGKTEIYAIDGQHLTSALDRLDIKSTECIVVENESIQEIVEMMAVLNNVNLRWHIMDYVNAYLGLGKTDYQILKSHSIANELNITTSAAILSGEHGWTSIKKGNFRAQASDSDVLTNNLNDFIRITGTKSAKAHRAYINFYRTVKSDYKHQEFISKLKACKIFKNGIPHDTSYLTAKLHEVHNFGM